MKISKLSTLVLFFFMLLMSFPKITFAQNQLWQTIVGNPEPPEVLVVEDGGGTGGGGGGSGQMVSCPSQNYRQCLIEQFNVSFGGGGTPAKYRDTYTGFRQFSNYTSFYNAFKKARSTITYSSSSVGPGGAWAIVDGYGNITFWNSVFTTASGIRYTHYFMIHEGMHVADNYLGRANENLYYNAYTLGKDKDCFNSYGVIKTYPHSLLSPAYELRRKRNETFADAAYNTIYCKSGETCPANGTSGSSISDFPNKCNYIYNFMNRVMN